MSQDDKKQQLDLNDIQERMYKLFRLLNIKPQNIGFEYAMDAIMIKLSEHNDIKIGDIYQRISKKRNVEYGRVERGIRYARENVFASSESKQIAEKIFDNKEKFSNAVFINSIFLFIKYNYREFIEMTNEKK